MRTNRVAILALQETHQMEDSIEELNKRYKNLKFFGSGLSTSSGGIMFVVSDGNGTQPNIGFEWFEKGRTGMLSLDYGDQKLNIVNVYMPNHKVQQKEALVDLRRSLDMKRDIINTELIVLGDWNFVEDRVDRSPQHDNDRRVTGEMAKLKATYDLTDGWRQSNPKARSFTWEGTTGSERKKIFSRIDRIYITRNTWEITNEYRIINCDVSDHNGVAVTIRDASAPEIGKGEAKMNMKILSHPLFRKEADQLLRKLESQLNRYGALEKKRCKPGREVSLQKLRDQNNPQTIWSSYKAGLLEASTRATQSRRTELLKLRRGAERGIKRAEMGLRDCEPEREEECRKILSEHKKTLSDYDEEARNTRTHLNEAKWFTNNERVSKQWFGLNKPGKSSTTIKSFFRADKEGETEDPKEMLEIAREYHSQLQSEPPMDKGRERAIDDILVNVKKKLDKKEYEEMGKDIRFKEVDATVRKAPNGKAPGPDGIPNEFWKLETKWRDQEKEKNKRQPDIAKEGVEMVRPCIAALMTKVFHDVEKFGPIDDSFTEARMGLLYKKKDKREVQNYRPITLLNTDYKVYTKIIANRLREVAPNLIHKDQAGFMPKRSIYDQTKIVELMIKWAQNTGNRGIIVCLDQEKAYDRIDLNYLWRVLRAFGFPEPFITRVRNLYKNASTAI